MTKCNTMNTIYCKGEEKISTDSNQEDKLIPSELTGKKATGLTKIRLEDCFRCDECSCIYLEEIDYSKHMKNFHGQPGLKRKRRARQKKGCRACCRNCKCQGKHKHTSLQKQLEQNSALQYNIKNRWSQLMEGTRLSTTSELRPEIKREPLDDPSLDYSHLLSQVEVRIKTEPIEEEYSSQ